MHWSQNYIGQPYAEANCAQLATQVQLEVFGKTVQLPDDIAPQLRGQSRQIESMQALIAYPVEQAIEGDAVLMKCRGCLSHVGVYCEINNQPYVLHSMKNAAQTVMHRLADLTKVGLSFEGFYRWH